MSGAALLLKGCRRPVVELSLASTMQCRCVFLLSVHRTRPIALRVASTVQEHSGAVQRNVRMAHDFEKRLDFLMDSLPGRPGARARCGCRRVRAAAAVRSLHRCCSETRVAGAQANVASGSAFRHILGKMLANGNNHNKMISLSNSLCWRSTTSLPAAHVNCLSCSSALFDIVASQRSLS